MDLQRLPVTAKIQLNVGGNVDSCAANTSRRKC